MLEKYFCEDICMIIYEKMLPVGIYGEVMVELIREAATQRLIFYTNGTIANRSIMRPSFVKVSSQILNSYKDPFSYVVHSTYKLPYYGWVETNE